MNGNNIKEPAFGSEHKQDVALFTQTYILLVIAIVDVALFSMFRSVSASCSLAGGCHGMNLNGSEVKLWVYITGMYISVLGLAAWLMMFKRWKGAAFINALLILGALFGCYLIFFRS